MPTNPKLLIFDIDGTLTHSAGLTRIAFDEAGLEIYCISNCTKGIRPYGKTDQGIFREILENNSLSVNGFDEQFERFMDLYIVRFAPIINHSDEILLFPGVAELLEQIEARSDLFTALGTGNIYEASRLKLKAQGIDHYFPTGGFGSDGEDRVEIIRTAYKKAKSFYGIDFSRCDTWVIGDTPNDVHCGRELGVKTMAVATGIHDVDQLTACEPTIVLQDLRDVEVVLEIFSNTHQIENDFKYY